MFELRKERQSYIQVRLNERKEVERTEVWIDCDALVREDGFRLVRIGRIPPVKEICFRYFKGDLKFDLYGDRTLGNGTVTDTWHVTLAFGDLRRGDSNVWPPDRREVEERAADIEAALRAWPQYPEERNIPIGVVHFQIRYLNNVTLRFGEHTPLRKEPPSTRWRRDRVPFAVKGHEYQCDSLVRDDGVRLIRMPMTIQSAEGPDTYHYLAADVEFDFHADRRMTLIVPTDTWEVNLSPRERGFSGLSAALRAQLGPTGTAEVIGNIEEALYAWPPAPDDADVPVNRVVFVGE